MDEGGVQGGGGFSAKLKGNVPSQSSRLRDGVVPVGEELRARKRFNADIDGRGRSPRRRIGLLRTAV